MKIEIGNMWTIWSETDHFIFTGNSVVKANGALVMGRGIAREVRDKFPTIDRAIGRKVEEHNFVTTGKPYGLLLGNKVGVFQVKKHWKDAAELDLIQHSVEVLTKEAEAKPEERFDMNFPGIGNGRLKYDDVLPLLQGLPDNVHVWTFNQAF